MTTIALPQAAVATRVKAVAALCLPLGVMNCVGAIVFWEWSVWTWVAVWAFAMGVVTVAGAVRALRGDGTRLLQAALVSQIVFTAMKLAVWQETEAVAFGAVALIATALIRERR
jgi:hypothetical protein